MTPTERRSVDEETPDPRFLGEQLPWREGNVSIMPCRKTGRRLSVPIFHLSYAQQLAESLGGDIRETDWSVDNEPK